MAHLGLSWLLLTAAVGCILLLSYRYPPARLLGAVCCVAGIGWAIASNDYELVPFEVILLAIAAMESFRSWMERGEVVRIEVPVKWREAA